ncbi:MAG TPA: sigma-70 family RNA polymerase sigma factor [Chloroflexota bacterium]|nr:sigma-70 family RNA polymerase sigma factor [Chloroflexota bacterium]
MTARPPVHDDPPGAGDEELVGRIARGDSAALGALYDRHGRLAFALAHRLLGDPTAAEDVVQEAFVALWRTAPRYDPARGVPRAWLLTTVRNRCIDILRGTRPSVPLETPDGELSLVAENGDVWEKVAQNLQAEDVQRALADLPEDQRTTIVFAYFKGMTHAQIAAHMEVPLGTVKGRLRLALGKLRELLEGTREGEPLRPDPIT